MSISQPNSLCTLMCYAFHAPRMNISISFTVLQKSDTI